MQQKSRLEALARAHARAKKKRTEREEDYIEVIYELEKGKGYVRAVDVSDHLHVKPSSVTSMIQKLSRQGLLEYEKYRGIKLTEKGIELAESVRRRHDLIVRFLTMVGVEESVAQEDAESIEHGMNPETLEKLTRFLEYIQRNPELMESFKKFIKDLEG